MRRKTKKGVVLIIGINGQDGSYLAEYLLQRGYAVVGIGRRKSPVYFKSSKKIRYCQLDICNEHKLGKLLIKLMPDKIYHVAAMHGFSGTLYENIWQDMLSVNTGSVHVILEFIRKNKPECTFTYANSGKLFGPEYPLHITENSKMNGSCLYTITKMAARDLILYYRDKYEINAGQLYLFNHESVRRPVGYFIPNILKILSSSIQNKGYKSTVNTLKFYCDWGCAKEYMGLMVEASLKKTDTDFVLGSGKTWFAEILVNRLFKNYGLDYKNHIVECKKLETDSSQIRKYKVDNSKLYNLLGKKPARDFINVCVEMLDEIHDFHSR